MNKIINLFSLVLFAVFSLLAIGSIYDLGFSVYEINDIPYIKQIVYGISLLIFLLGLIRIKRRLEGRKDIKNYQNFIFSTPLSKAGIGNASLFLGIEIVFGLGLLLILLKINEWDEQNLILPLFIIMSILAAENILYLIYFHRHTNRFKIGIGPQFIAYFDREMHIYYFKGLTRIEVYQNMVNFRYKNDLNLFLNLNIIPTDKQADFFAKLEDTLSDKGVFFDDSYHQFIASLKT
jgi:hypothetical protein